MITEITQRRSIRKYKDKPVPPALIEEIVQAGALAPSSQNQQPWKFIAVSGHAKEEMLEVFQRGMEREKSAPLLPKSAGHLAGVAHTVQIMRQAPVILFCVNPLGIPLGRSLTPEERIAEICNVQSIGAALENMSLAAVALGLGSLWICDTFFAHEELCRFLKADGLVAAMAIGYPEETPAARPRKSQKEILEWRE